MFDRLDLTTHSFMEKNVQLLLGCLHSLNEYVEHAKTFFIRSIFKFIFSSSLLPPPPLPQ